MTRPADIAPTQGLTASSYEWILEVGVIPTTPGAPIDWLTYPDITALQPNPTDRTSDGSTYANKGQEDTSIIGESFNLSLNAKVVKNQDGDLHPALALLVEAANAKLPGGNPARKVIAARFYHYSIASMAYQYTAEVSWTRANTGNADNEFLSLTLSAKGDRRVIPNPALQPEVAPVITAVTPSGATEGTWISIEGTDLSRVSAITVGGEAVVEYQVSNSTLVFAKMPAGTAGSAPVKVTTSGGESNSFAYTRG